MTIEPPADFFNGLNCWWPDWPLTSFWQYFTRYRNPQVQWRCRQVTSFDQISFYVTLLLDAHFIRSQTLEDFSFCFTPLGRLNNKHGKLISLNLWPKSDNTKVLCNNWTNLFTNYYGSNALFEIESRYYQNFWAVVTTVFQYLFFNQGDTPRNIYNAQTFYKNVSGKSLTFLLRAHRWITLVIYLWPEINEERTNRTTKQR